MYMYKRGGSTASAMIERLQDLIADLSLLNSEDIVYCDINISEAKNIVHDIHNNHSKFHSITNEEMEKAFSGVPPHLLVRYLDDAEEYARDSDGFYERQFESFQMTLEDEIMQFLPKEFVEKCDE